MLDGTQELSLTEAAMRLGISWHQAWRLVLTRQLDGHKDGTTWRVTEKSVRHFEQNRHVSVQAE